MKKARVVFRREDGLCLQVDMGNNDIHIPVIVEIPYGRSPSGTQGSKVFTTLRANITKVPCSIVLQQQLWLQDQFFGSAIG